jgi:hypothetical protein
LRDDLDLQRHVDYVHINPLKHGLVARVRNGAFHFPPVRRARPATARLGWRIHRQPVARALNSKGRSSEAHPGAFRIDATIWTNPGSAL